LNLRPSGYEPDELPGCSTPRYIVALRLEGALVLMSLLAFGSSIEDLRLGLGGLARMLSCCVWFHGIEHLLCRPGNDLLSQVLRHSTIGAEEFNGRVRDGIGFRLLASATRPAKQIVKRAMCLSNRRDRGQRQTRCLSLAARARWLVMAHFE
jgi:hypothetical protein